MEKNLHKQDKRRNSLKSSALQLTVVISLIITLILGSLIYLYAFYRNQDIRITNKTNVLYLMEAGIHLGTSSYLPIGDTTIQDFLTAGDQLWITKKHWGLFDVVTVVAKQYQDSLQKAFLIGPNETDSTVLYLMDEDRNLSVSGKTIIQGTAYLPKSGIKPAFVEGKYYEGVEKIVEGKIVESTNKLPEINTDRLQSIYSMLEKKSTIIKNWNGDRRVSFFSSSQFLYDSHPININLDTLSGNIMIISDSLISISNANYIENAICIAPVIRVSEGFVGKIQLFALDSISIGKNSKLQYPSSIVLKAETNSDQKQIRIDNNVQIEGNIVLYEEKKSDIPHMIDFGENNKIYGDILCYGLLKYKKPLTVFGSVACYRFVTQTTQSLYENYLIDIVFDRYKRSKYYVNGFLKHNDSDRINNKVVCWLN